MKNRLRQELEAMLELRTGDSFTADNVHTLVNGIFAADEGGGFVYVEYDDSAFHYPQTIGSTADSIVGLGPANESMIDTIFIMPNKETDPTATMMIVVDEKEPSTDPKTYQYVYVGNINTLPSNVLTESSIVNDLSTGGTNKPLSAEQGRTLNSHVNYTTCGSNAGDQIKLISDDGFELSTHLRLLVMMTNTNTNSTPKFNINNTGVKDVWYNGSVASDINTWSAGEVLDVYYDGTKYIANTHGGAQFSTGEKVGDIGIDDEPTVGSDNLVKSGGVKSAIQNARNRQYYTSYFQDRRFWDEVDYINGWRNQKDASYQVSYNFVTLKFDISKYISKELNIFFTTAADSYHYFGDGTNAFALFVVEDENGNNTIYSDTHPTYKQVNHTVTFDYTPTSGDKYLYISIVKNYGTVSIVSNYDYRPLFLLPIFKNDKQYLKLNDIVNYFGSSEVKVTSQKFTTQKVQSVNLFNTEDTDILVNQIYNAGTLVTQYNYNTSGFIPLHKGEILKYTCFQNAKVTTTWPYLQVTLFDANKNYIGFIHNPSTLGYVTTDKDNCAYIRFTYFFAESNYIVISYDENVSEYIEFYDLENLYNKTKSIRDDISGDFFEALTIDWAYDKNFWFIQGTTVSHNSGSYNSYKAGIVDVSQLVGKNIVINVASNSQTNTSSIGSAFADDNFQKKGNYFEIKPNAKPYIVTVPSGATQLCITCYKPSIETDDGVYFLIPIGKEVEKLDNNVKSLMSRFDFNNNQWQGKKILWLGTSIPWGQSDEDYPGTSHRVDHPYPQQVCDALGATLIDSTHGGLAQMASFTEAVYSVIKTTELTEEPSGTLLSTMPTLVTNSNYPNTPVEWLTEFPELPTTQGLSKTYYIAVSGTTTTYTKWEITKTQYVNVWFPKPYSKSAGSSSGGSTSLTIQECQNAVTAGLATSNQSTYSYENTILNKNADLYVFDVEPNNSAEGSDEDLALFDWRLWKYTDNSTFASHRNSYIGALIYEIDTLLTEKPDAIVVFVGEYNLLSLTNYNVPYPMRIQSIALCDKFHIHYIDLAEKLFYVGKNLSQWVNTDNIHPKQAAYTRMAKMLVNELLLIA